MIPLPRPKLALRPSHLGAFAALTLGAVAHGADHGRVQIGVPEALTDGRDLDLVSHTWHDRTGK